MKKIKKLREFKQRKNGMFYCFSPLVMIVTVIVEVLLALFILFKLRKNTTVWLGFAIIVLLAVFQLAEYAICTALGLSEDWWGRIGFSAITLLPPLGLHLVYSVKGIKISRMLILAYLSALIWIVMFLQGYVINGQQCTTNYLIFDMKDRLGGAFFFFYYFWLLYATTKAVEYRKSKDISKQSRKSLTWFLVGYAAFIVPATIIWLFFEQASKGLPSIMCGFAIILAIILGTKVIPAASDRQSKK